MRILQEHREQGIPISQLARKNDIHAVTIYQWKRTMTQDDDSITPEKIRGLISEISKLKLENEHLKFKVADLSVTNDIMTEAIEISKKRNFETGQIAREIKGKHRFKITDLDIFVPDFARSVGLGPASSLQ
jgi:transposase-like protein